MCVLNCLFRSHIFILMLPSEMLKTFSTRRAPFQAPLRMMSLAELASVLTSTVLPLSAVFHPAYAQAANPTQTLDGRTFSQLMDVGYRASAQGDFNTALINFRRALELRPNEPYASAAADNMAFYIEHARMSARQWEIDQLETRLANARAQKDWVCAATTIDQLTMYTESGSLNRERLIGHRGEISGLLDARMDFDSWSTVCGAQRPVY